MPTRSQRRRALREALASSDVPTRSQPLLRGRPPFIAAAIAGGIVAIAAAGVLLVMRGGGGDSAAFVARTDDEKAIESLARRSIEVLTAGQWPSLYDSFTPEYQ